MCQPLRSSLAHLGPVSHALVGALYFCDSKLRKKIRPYFMYINILSKEKKGEEFTFSPQTHTISLAWNSKLDRLRPHNHMYKVS